jgi:hypothetical protein
MAIYSNISRDESNSQEVEHSNWINAPICRLPEDLLGRMICDWVKPVRQAKMDVDEAQSYQWIISLISVCRRIRTVCINFPGLWADISIGYGHTQWSGLEWLETCVSRAQSHPLNLKMLLKKTPYTPTPKLYTMISTHVSRVGTLYLGFAGIRWSDIDDLIYFQFLFNLSWSALRELTYYPFDYSSISPLELMRPNRSVPTPATLFPRGLKQLTHLCIPSKIPWPLHALPDMPNLRHLHIHTLSFSEAGMKSLDISTRFPRLVELHIKTCIAEDNPSIVSRTLHTLLIPATNLESLSLCHMSYASTNMRVSARPLAQLDLPRLRSVSLSGSAHFISDILSVLPDPHEALELGILNDNHDDARTGDLLTGIIARAIAYTKASRENIPRAQYVLVFGASTYGQSYVSLEPASVPEVKCSHQHRMKLCGRELDDKYVGHIMAMGDFVKVLPGASLETVFNVISACSHVITRLVLVSWDEYWKSRTEPERLITLEICLWDLVWEDARLQILDVDASSREDETLGKWLAEGLVGRVHFRDNHESKDEGMMGRV